MTESTAMFLFTADRPELLAQSLTSIADIGIQTLVIDDSSNDFHRRQNLRLTRNHATCLYLGRQEFREFKKRYQLDDPKYSFLLEDLGTPEWNLGYARNFALLLSRCLRIKNVLFMDDDIQVREIGIVEKLFSRLDEYHFVGANIEQMADNSVVEHIATSLGVLNPTVPSGGFLAFRPDCVSDYFLNCYNEDWIWLYLQLSTKRSLQIEGVDQSVTDVYFEYRAKTMFQEFGEIMIEGLVDVYSEARYDDLASIEFWEEVVRERQTYLDSLVTLSLASNNNEHTEILRWVKNSLHPYDAHKFADTFRKYFHDRINFQDIFAELAK